MLKQCHCGYLLPYVNCCEPLHKGKHADTAEALMRSRYSAYVLKKVEYLIQTRHPKYQHLEDPKSLQHTFDTTQWHNLTITDVQAGESSDTQGVVAFLAHYSDKSGDGDLFERSNFEKVNGVWFYTTGTSKPLRNEPCWCGSGKKYKKCHG